MDNRAPISSLCHFKENQIDVEPQLGSVIQIQVPSTSTFSIRSRQQRRILHDLPVYKDIDAYSSQYLASSASIHFSKSSRYPRNFLWRIVQDQSVLEVRSIDLSKSEDEVREAGFIVRFQFPNRLKSGGVAFADTGDAKLPTIFALTKGNELYTLTLPQNIFSIAAASEEDAAKWCKVAQPATFSISTPHRLIAGSPLHLIVSLSDGRLLRLTRDKADDGSRWHESIYGDGQWTSSLRGLVRWQGSNIVKYDGATLEDSTPAALAVSPDSEHIFAVCLNHTLRIWNPKKAASVFTKDLLWQRREPHDIPKLMLDPANPNVLQLFESRVITNGDLYYAVTFSPHDFGQFKFWGIRDPDHGDKGIHDLYPDNILKPPDPDPNPESKAIWKMVDFKVGSDRSGQGIDIWVLMRSNRSCKVYNLKAELENIATMWRDRWTTVATETMGEHLQPQDSDSEPSDATEKWLEYIFYPGRYSVTVLESALAIYCSERSVTPANLKSSLQERMSSAILSQIKLGPGPIDFEKWRELSQHEWAIFWQCIRDLDDLRRVALSICHDQEINLPWLVFADGCSAVRTCSKTEMIAQNSHSELAQSVNLFEQQSIEMEIDDEPILPDELAVLIEAASSFRQEFSYPFRQACDSALATELWLDPSGSIRQRMEAFYDQCNFAEEISQAQFDDLDASLDVTGGITDLDTGSFLAILESFSHDLPPKSADLAYTQSGLKSLINGAREMIHLREQMLLDQLAMVVFLEMEIDREETPMRGFDGPKIYVALLDLLKQYQTMQWLAAHTLETNSQGHQQKAEVGTGAARRPSPTLLESIYVVDLKPQSHEMQSQSEALTKNIQDLLKWVAGGNERLPLTEIAVYIQCYLLANSNIQSASEFLRFQPFTAWGTYVKGRLYLMRGETTEASLSFEKAAHKLSRPTKFDYQGASHSFISPMEAAHFGHGLPTYYTHIMNLFTAASAPSDTAHFANLALKLIPSSPPSDQSTSILTSLFDASLQITDFSNASSALTRHPSPKTLLPKFLKTLFDTPNALPQLLSIPFPPNLHPEIDSILDRQKNPQILASWRLHHDDYRGAAAALLPSLLQAQMDPKRAADDDLEKDYLTIINLLACAGKENAWILAKGFGKDGFGDTGAGKGHAVPGPRRVFTIDDLRARYQKELDHRSAIEGGRFGFVGGDEMNLL